MGLFLFAAACGGGKPAEDATSANESGGDSNANPATEGSGNWSSTATPTPTSKPTSTTPTDTTPKTVYDKEAVEMSLTRAARQVKDHCGQTKDDKGKATGPWGKVTISVQLGHNGHSKGATVPAPFSDTPVGKCINNAFTNLIYPPFAGQDTTVDWEVESVKPTS